MEVSLMEGGIARLQSPALPSRLADLGFGGGTAARDPGSLWRWGALLLVAALAAYGSLIARARLLLRRLRGGRHKPALLQPQQQHFFSDDDDTCSLCSSDENDEEEEILSSEEEEEEAREGYVGEFAESEGYSDGVHLRQLPELARGGKEVVKSWDARDLRFDDSGVGGPFSMWDRYRGEVVRSFLAAGSSRVAACVAVAQPAVVLSAGDSFGLWDTRVGGRTPVTSTDLPPRLRRRVMRFGGAGKVVYVGDGGGSATEVDLRAARSSMRGVAEDDATWWNADAVVVGGGVAGFEEGAWSPATYQFRPRRK